MVLIYLFIVISFANGSNIFCLIHTATPSHETRAQTIYETWARRCDRFIFFTDSPMAPHIPHKYWPELHSRDHSWEKIRRIFNYVIEGIEEKFDWYLRADDDAYIILENLRRFLANHSPDKPHFMGYRWNFYMPHGFVDGGAYVLSRPAVEAFNQIMKKPELCPDHHRAEEDQEMGKCLEAAGIYPEDTRDDYGSDRFHHFHPTEQLIMYKDLFARKFAYYIPMKGVENFSPQMISFHHISPYEMRTLDYIFYRLKRKVLPKVLT